MTDAAPKLYPTGSGRGELSRSAPLDVGGVRLRGRWPLADARGSESRPGVAPP